MINKIRNWMTWKRFWTIHGYIQMGIVIAFYMIGDIHMAYSSSLAAMAFFGIAECKKEEEKNDD